MKNNKLLEKAKSVPPKGKWRIDNSPEQLELAIELIKGNLTYMQVAHAMGYKYPNSANHWAFSVIRRAFVEGKISINMNI